MSIVHRKLKPVDQNVRDLALETETKTENYRIQAIHVYRKQET